MSASNTMTAESRNTLDTLFTTIKSRRTAAPDKSYTAQLFYKGRARIAQKVGEEAVEVVIESMKGDTEGLKAESADLLYHLLVLWADAGLTPEDVYDVLEQRAK